MIHARVVYLFESVAWNGKNAITIVESWESWLHELLAHNDARKYKPLLLEKRARRREYGFPKREGERSANKILDVNGSCCHKRALRKRKAKGETNWQRESEAGRHASLRCLGPHSLPHPLSPSVTVTHRRHRSTPIFYLSPQFPSTRT